MIIVGIIVFYINAPTDEFYLIVYWHNSVQHVSCRLELLKETFFSVIYYYGFHINFDLESLQDEIIVCDLLGYE
jgi:hypothetical protein